MFNLIKTHKSTIEKKFPRFLLDKSKSFYSILKKNEIEKNRKNFRKHLQSSKQSPIWLEEKQLELLHQKYPPLPDKLKNHVKTSVKRAKKRTEDILSLVSNNLSKELNNSLELGCGDGMVSYFLQAQGKNATAIDIYSGNFNDQAVNGNVTLLEMDAADLHFEDESFDFVFSYDGFEHFPEPELVLQNAIKVLKPGGYLYLKFEPLYMSPFGLHAWQLINIPYCHFLFSRELLQDFTGESGRTFFANVDKALNQWTVEKFRSLWRSYSMVLKTCQYYEGYNANYLDMINKYPTVFISKTKEFDNLICDSIEALFQKK